jgi:hypothetical protein
MAVSWDVAPCSLVETDRRLRNTSCLHHEGQMMEAVHTSESSFTSRLHGAIVQKAVSSSYSSPWEYEISQGRTRLSGQHSFVKSEIHTSLSENHLRDLSVDGRILKFVYKIFQGTDWIKAGHEVTIGSSDRRRSSTGLHRNQFHGQPSCFSRKTLFLGV